MANELAEKICMITGALGGIGRASTELFASRGATVVIRLWDVSAKMTGLS